MYNRRKTEHTRAKRTVKKSKPSETFSSSYMQYAKVFLIWAFLMGIDFLLEFRFEYLWPCWLLLRSVHDSFKYQGLLFSLFFLVIALMSDIICYMFVPVTLLFFLGSYYVWVQLLWQTERGICLPTIIFCILFLYVEFSYRLRLPKSVSLNFDLCRPFAAHCIGYPVVTLGFGVKSYISYRFRLRKQADVQEENAFYIDLLDEALPDDCRSQSENQLLESKRKHPVNGLTEPQEEIEYCEQHMNSLCSCNSNNSALALPLTNCEDTPDDSSCINSGNSCKSSLSHRASKSLANTLKNSLVSMTSTVNRKLCSSTQSNGYLHSHSQSNSANSSETASTSSSTGGVLTNHTSGAPSSTLCNGVGGSSQGNGSVNHSSSTSSAPANSPSTNLQNGSISTTNSSTVRGNKSAKGQAKDETFTKLESDIKRLKNELQSRRSCEAELRNQLLLASQAERSARMELEQIRQDAESSQNRIHNLVQRNQSDRAQVQQMEKRLSEERKQKQVVEQQLTNEKKARREHEQQLQSAIQRQNQNTSNCNSAMPSVVQATQTRIECNDWCKNKRRDLESDVKSFRRELHQRDDRLKQMMDDLNRCQTILDERDKAFMSIKSERDRLNLLLSDENRIKQELFTAYHAAMKENNALSESLTKYKCEVHSLKAQLFNSDLASILGSSNLSGNNSNGVNWATSSNPPLSPFDYSQLPVQSSMLHQPSPMDSGVINQHQHHHQMTNGSSHNNDQHLFSHQDVNMQQFLNNLIGGPGDLPLVNNPRLHSNSSSPGVQINKLQSGADNFTQLPPTNSSSANLSGSIDGLSCASMNNDMHSGGYLSSSSPHF